MTRRLVVNPSEPRTGDDGFTVYDSAHPLNGSEDTTSRFRAQLKGLRGHAVTITVKGQRQDQSGATRNWSARRTIVLNSYTDIFGSSGVLLSALKAQLKKDSDSKLTVREIDVDDETGEDDTEEDEE